MNDLTNQLIREFQYGAYYPGQRVVNCHDLRFTPGLLFLPYSDRTILLPGNEMSKIALAERVMVSVIMIAVLAIVSLVGLLLTRMGTMIYW